MDASSLQEMVNSLRDDICGKIDSLSTDLRSEIATVRAELKSVIAPLQHKVEKHDSTIRDLEHAASNQSDHLSELNNIVQTLRTQVDQLNAKCEDLEGRSRRNNIRLIGILEDVEGPNPTEFVSGLLQDILSLYKKPILDRAHRSLREKPGKDKPPRPFIIRLHYYQDSTQGWRGFPPKLPREKSLDLPRLHNCCGQETCTVRGCKASPSSYQRSEVQVVVPCCPAENYVA